MKKRDLQIFLCYSHKDREVVRDLYTRLKRDGADAWLDKESLLPGADWEREIREAILKSDAVIVCLSRHFNRRGGYRQQELSMARQKADFLPEDQIFIVPARLEECDVPGHLRSLQRVDLFQAGGYKKLRYALRSLLKAG